MKLAGIDVGSRTIKFVLLEEGQIILSKKVETSFNPIEQIRSLLLEHSHDSLFATGYGRQLVQKHFASHVVTEIKAFACGASFLRPDFSALLDIGGQDTKVIYYNPQGKVLKFEMNDKCAAGTGKFLETMSMALGVSLNDFGSLALNGKSDLTINNTCTVFAESEVVSLVTQGHSLNQIAYAIHKTVAQKAIQMIQRLNLENKKVLFAGGVALNPAIAAIVEDLSDISIAVPDMPQFVGALGAALMNKDYL